MWRVATIARAAFGRPLMGTALSRGLVPPTDARQSFRNHLAGRAERLHGGRLAGALAHRHGQLGVD